MDRQLSFLSLSLSNNHRGIFTGTAEQIGPFLTMTAPPLGPTEMVMATAAQRSVSTAAFQMGHRSRRAREASTAVEDTQNCFSTLTSTTPIHCVYVPLPSCVKVGCWTATPFATESWLSVTVRFKNWICV